MIAKLSQRGTSFNGVSAYLLHDKREEGENHRNTSKRVEWTATRNIMSDNAEFAFRVMSATAMDKDRLKQEAGISTAGRKSKGDVYHYSLAWHPDEQGKFSKNEMLEAVDSSLKKIGATDHQAVIVAHNDEPQPHVHIVVNLVDPKTGKNLPLNYDRKKLDEWAYEYRKERGEEQKYCPNRDKKAKAIEAKKQGQKVPFVAGDNVPRHLISDFDDAKAHVTADDLKLFKRQQAELYKQNTTAVYIDGEVKHLNLSEYGKYQKSEHTQQANDLDQKFKQQKATIEREYKQEKLRAEQAIELQMKPAFTEARRQNQNDRAFWEKRDKRLVGKLQNVISTVEFTLAIGRAENKNAISSFYSALSNAGVRKQALDRQLNARLKTLTVEQNRQKKQAVSMVKARKKDRLSTARENYREDKKTLTTKQGRETSELKSRWRDFGQQKRLAFKALKQKGLLRANDAKTVEKAEVKEAKKQFEDIKDKKPERPKRKRKPRSRKRTRNDD